MSATPRTLQEECYGTCWAACERIAELERELNEANTQIKRLELAGNRLLEAWGSEKDIGYVPAAVRLWRETKEIKT